MTTNKILIGVGAFAFAAAASLTPLVAQAEPAGDSDSSASADAGSVGNAAGRKPARATRGSAGNAQAPQAQTPQAPQARVNGARSTAANALGPNPLFQNPLWWFGTPNPTPPPTIATRNFDALASLPGWARGYYGWYDNLDFEACVLGLSSTFSPNLGPYGTSTNSISTGGC
jgi:hypothetical protein